MLRQGRTPGADRLTFHAIDLTIDAILQVTPRTWAALVDELLAHVEAGGTPRRIFLAEVGRERTGRRALRGQPSLAEMASLLDAAARSLGNPSVGLHLAERFELATLGPFSYAVLNAPTLGTALRNVERYSGSVASDAQPRLEVEGDTASLVLPTWGDDSEDFRQLSEAATLVLLRMLHRLAGPGWSPLAVELRHARPPDVGEHRRLLGSVVRFGCPADRIRFAKADLDRTVHAADRFLLPIVELQLKDVVADGSGADPWLREVEMTVASHVCDGHPGIRTIAPRLGSSVRTLQRRLEERGLSYKQVVADVRLRLARQYLEESGPSLGEIAFLLGYSELSAFDRAFRKWTGDSPGRYRRGTRSDAPRSG